MLAAEMPHKYFNTYIQLVKVKVNVKLVKKIAMMNVSVCSKLEASVLILGLNLLLIV